MQPDVIKITKSSSVALHARAYHTLTHSFGLPPSISGGPLFFGDPRVRLWHDPSGFCIDDLNPFTLTVFEPFTEGSISGRPVVREAVWLRHEDIARLKDQVDKSKEFAVIHPTFTVRDGEIPTREFSELLKEAESFRVPVVWLDHWDDCEVGEDGVNRKGFEFFSRERPPAVIGLHWSYDMPESWQPITKWFEKMREFLVGCLPEKRNRCNLP